MPLTDKFDKSLYINTLQLLAQLMFEREIRIGRQNPQYYEVLEGLESGEKVITSGYDNFGDNEVLIF